MADVELLNFDGPESDGDLFQPSTGILPEADDLAASSPRSSECRPAIYERLTSYLLLGTGQSSGLDARRGPQGVAHLTGSDELAAAGGRAHRAVRLDSLWEPDR